MRILVTGGAGFVGSHLVTDQARVPLIIGQLRNPESTRVRERPNRQQAVDETLRSTQIKLKRRILEEASRT